MEGAVHAHPDHRAESTTAKIVNQPSDSWQRLPGCWPPAILWFPFLNGANMAGLEQFTEAMGN
ncbi:MAG: hypothetical protein KJ749_01395, partial [Planctomycetes bacterium]|nr:hypothetical protein [Planctomycetota bacterium]